MKLSTLAVHPAYWKRGHGGRLIKWCTDLADMDHEVLAVSAQKMSIGLYERARFECREYVEVEGYERHPNSIFLWIGLRDPVVDGK
jgi:GNAT superfamily N-acetyltransferase